MAEKFYGGCGVESCVECLPLYNEKNEVIPGTDDAEGAIAFSKENR